MNPPPVKAQAALVVVGWLVDVWSF